MSTKKDKGKLLKRPNKSSRMTSSVSITDKNHRKFRLQKCHSNLTSSPLELVFSCIILSSCTRRCIKEWKTPKRIQLLTRSSTPDCNFWSNSCTSLETWLVQMMKLIRETPRFSRPTSFTMTSALFPSILSCCLITRSTLSSSLLIQSSSLILCWKCLMNIVAAKFSPSKHRKNVESATTRPKEQI